MASYSLTIHYLTTVTVTFLETGMEISNQYPGYNTRMTKKLKEEAGWKRDKTEIASVVHCFIFQRILLRQTKVRYSIDIN